VMLKMRGSLRCNNKSIRMLFLVSPELGDRAGFVETKKLWLRRSAEWICRACLAGLHEFILRLFRSSRKAKSTSIMAIRILKYALLSIPVVALLAVVSILYLQRTSDGPIEPMQGGPFRTGDVVEMPVEDWSFAAASPVAFELEGFGSSRMAGYIMYEGQAYMTCDLGFIWNRLEPGMQKFMLRMMYTFKHWHTDALEDGRIRLRIDGRIFRAQLEKVEDPQLNQSLRRVIEEQARDYFAPMDLPAATSDEPNDIWFFKIESRV